MDIQVEVLGEEIVVTRLGTDFMIAYRKRSDSPTLKLTRSWVGPHITSPEISEFRAKAFQAAISKARELGWIVWGFVVAERDCSRSSNDEEAISS